MLTQTISQPDRDNAPGLPSFEQLENYEDAIAQQFRLVSAGMEHAEQFVRRAFSEAKKCKEAEAAPEFPLALHQHGYRFLRLRYCIAEAHRCSF